MANEQHASREVADYVLLLSESFNLEGYPTSSTNVRSLVCEANESPHLDEQKPYSDSTISQSKPECFVSDDNQIKNTELHARTHYSPKDARTSATGRYKPRPRRIVRLGWWGEIGSFMLSIICTVLIFVILIKMDGKPMSKWRLPIQPNSLIAVFSTLAKSSLLYPIAECLGQLKWTYFECPRPLDRMEVFDGATRGPWGSLIFLWKTKGTMLLASLGALVTVILLAFEPFAQQAIDFTTHLALLKNVTGSVTKTSAWSDVNFEGSRSPLNDYAQYHLSSGFLQTFADQPMSGFSNAYCPTKKCTVPNFISLAACATCTEESISEEYFDTCIYELSHLENATKTFTNFTNAQDMREYLRTNPEYLEIHVMCTKGFPQFPRFTVELSIRDGASSLLHIENAVGEKQESTSTDQGVTIASKGTYLQSCASASHVVEEKSTKIVGQTCFKSTTDLALYNITDHIGQINGTVSNCRLDFCAKKYENILIVRGEMPSQSTTDILLELQNRSAPENSTDDVWQVKESQDFGLIDFKVGAMSRGLLTIAVEDMFDDWMIRRCLYYVDISRTASFGNWTQRFYHLADILSVIIQATTNPNATNVTGQAYEDEIYVHIHWGWIIMPISIVVISGLFLTLTIVESGKKSYLFKTSIIAVLFHGLDGWNVSNLPTPTKMNKETSEGLAKESEGIVVMLKENNENNLKLVKV